MVKTPFDSDVGIPVAVAVAFPADFCCEPFHTSLRSNLYHNTVVVAFLIAMDILLHITYSFSIVGFDAIAPISNIWTVLT